MTLDDLRQLAAGVISAAEDINFHSPYCSVSLRVMDAKDCVCGLWNLHNASRALEIALMEDSP